jgi:two-component system sensor histidine kinase/response regulator
MRGSEHSVGQARPADEARPAVIPNWHDGALATDVRSRNERRYGVVVETMQEGVWTFDTGYRTTFVNGRMAAMLGYQVTEMIGLSLFAVVQDWGRDIAVSPLAVPVDGQRAEYEPRLRRRDGSELWAELLISWSADPSAEGHLEGLAIVNDITVRERTKHALAAALDDAIDASQLKSQFLATMSHEIRTPMNGVIGLTGLLLDTELSDIQRTYADGVRASGEALLGIINDILDFSKIEAGKLELEMVDFDLAQALDDVAFLVAQSARAKGLELVVYCDPGMPTAVRGDIGRLRQVLLNLMSNAVKFTDSGEVVMRACSGPSQDGERVDLRVEVVDTGIGMAPESVERLFEPFAQADASTTRRYGGTGLGMAISRQLVEAMGGTIGVESELGRGSDFWVDLSLARASQPVHASAGPPPLPTGLRALVVDDNRTSRVALGSQLMVWDVDVDLAPDADAALGYLRQAAREGRPYDLAVVDADMPGLDGLELARIVTADPSLRSVRLLLLTSGPLAEGDATMAGVSVTLAKPVRLSQIQEVLVRVLAPSAEQAAPQPPTTPAIVPGSKGRLLIVEDNVINQAVARAIAGKLGYSCDVAGNGNEALAASAHLRYDAMLMDVHMPEMDGYEATAELRRREAGGPRTPIIAMTAGASAEDRTLCLDAGMDDYLAKPVRAGELERMLTRWLPAARAEPAVEVPAR